MKRFYKDVTVDRAPEGWRILLDGRPVKTPGRNDLLLPQARLAEFIAGEWRGQSDEITPFSMPMLRMANTVIDGVTSNRESVIAAILRFGEHDAICHRASYPADLVARQQEAWTPMLEWTASRYDARLETVVGLGEIEQPPQVLAKLRDAIAAHDDFALAALHVMASITGSLVLALALADGAINPAQAFQMSRLEEDHQAAQWGQDAEASARAQALAREMDVAMAFLAASRP
jgi:chaperone required for assembly of F1-ATPase